MSQTQYSYNILDTATSDVEISKLEKEIINESLSSPIDYINKANDIFYIYFSNPITDQEKVILDSVVSTHQHITTAESLKKYLSGQVFPFIELLINTFAAENISMGITQSGKTVDVLALFEMPISLGNVNRKVSLKGSFDTGSLYTSIDILEYHIDNIADYSDLTPFVTVERLEDMKTKIQSFLVNGS